MNSGLRPDRPLLEIVHDSDGKLGTQFKRGRGINARRSLEFLSRLGETAGYGMAHTAVEVRPAGRLLRDGPTEATRSKPIDADAVLPALITSPLLFFAAAKSVVGTRDSAAPRRIVTRSYARLGRCMLRTCGRESLPTNSRSLNFLLSGPPAFVHGQRGRLPGSVAPKCPEIKTRYGSAWPLPLGWPQAACDSSVRLQPTPGKRPRHKNVVTTVV
jgi:hypothetical protein